MKNNEYKSPSSMTGLDQDMMQRNLSSKNIRDAQKNMMERWDF